MGMISIKVKVLRKLDQLLNLIGLGLAVFQQLRKSLGKVLGELRLVGSLLLLYNQDMSQLKT